MEKHSARPGNHHGQNPGDHENRDDFVELGADENGVRRHVNLKVTCNDMIGGAVPDCIGGQQHPANGGGEASD